MQTHLPLTVRPPPHHHHGKLRLDFPPFFYSPLFVLVYYISSEGRRRWLGITSKDVEMESVIRSARKINSGDSPALRAKVPTSRATPRRTSWKEKDDIRLGLLWLSFWRKSAESEGESHVRVFLGERGQTLLRFPCSAQIPINSILSSPFLPCCFWEFRDWLQVPGKTSSASSSTHSIIDKSEFPRGEGARNVDPKLTMWDFMPRKYERVKGMWDFEKIQDFWEIRQEGRREA